MSDTAKRIMKFVSGMFFPSRCPYCDRVIPTESLSCGGCAKVLFCAPVKRYTVEGYRCCAAFVYSGVYSEAVKRFKFKGRAVYSLQLGRALARAVSVCYPQGFDLVTFVPMHADSLKTRGYNQAELLARDCALSLNLPYSGVLSKPVKNKPQHMMKGRQERRKNVKGVFALNDSVAVSGKRVLLVDDIVTSGSTLYECAKLLEKAGAAVSCAAVCSAEYINI